MSSWSYARRRCDLDALAQSKRPALARRLLHELEQGQRISRPAISPINVRVFGRVVAENGGDLVREPLAAEQRLEPSPDILALVIRRSHGVILVQIVYSLKTLTDLALGILRATKDADALAHAPLEQSGKNEPAAHDPRERPVLLPSVTIWSPSDERELT